MAWQGRLAPVYEEIDPLHCRVFAGLRSVGESRAEDSPESGCDPDNSTWREAEKAGCEVLACLPVCDAAPSSWLLPRSDSQKKYVSLRGGFWCWRRLDMLLGSTAGSSST